jgi:hypothetical protein
MNRRCDCGTLSARKRRLNRTAVLAQIKHLLQAGVILRLLGIASEQHQLIFRKASREENSAFIPNQHFRQLQ